MGCIVEGETARFVIVKHGCWFAKRALDRFAGLSEKTMLLNNLIASVVEADNLRAVETHITDHIYGDGKYQRHRRYGSEYDLFHFHLMPQRRA